VDSADIELQLGYDSEMSEAEQFVQEDLWGYKKRLGFIESVISDCFNRSAEEVRILDVGCGNGSQLTLPLSKRGFQLTGVDLDERSIAKAKSLAAGISGAQFICGELKDLSSGESFDVVILSEVLEHLAEPEALLKAALARMNRESVMIVTVPNGFGEFEWDSWMFRGLRLQTIVDAVARGDRQVLASTENHESGHVQFFTRRRLQRLFKQFQLKIVREESGSFLSGPMVGHTLARSQRFVEWNARVTKRLPFSWASSWYFALRRQMSAGGEDILDSYVVQE